MVQGREGGQQRCGPEQSFRVGPGALSHGGVPKNGIKQEPECPCPTGEELQYFPSNPRSPQAAPRDSFSIPTQGGQSSLFPAQRCRHHLQEAIAEHTYQVADLGEYLQQTPKVCGQWGRKGLGLRLPRKLSLQKHQSGPQQQPKAKV